MADNGVHTLTKAQVETLFDFVSSHGPYLFSRTVQQMSERGRNTWEMESFRYHQLKKELENVGLKLPDCVAGNTVKVMVNGSPTTLIRCESFTSTNLEATGTFGSNTCTEAVLNMRALLALCEEHKITGKKQAVVAR